MFYQYLPSFENFIKSRIYKQYYWSKCLQDNEDIWQDCMLNILESIQLYNSRRKMTLNSFIYMRLNQYFKGVFRKYEKYEAAADYNTVNKKDVAEIAVAAAHIFETLRSLSDSEKTVLLERLFPNARVLEQNSKSSKLQLGDTRVRLTNEAIAEFLTTRREEVQRILRQSA